MNDNYKRLMKAFLVSVFCITLVCIFTAGTLTASRRTESILLGTQYDKALVVSSPGHADIYIENNHISVDKSIFLKIYSYIKYIMPGCVNAFYWMIEIIGIND